MDKLEIKATLSVDDAGTISGIAWPFGEPDTVGDLIEPGAFNPAAAMAILYEHDGNRGAIGSWEEIAETDAGLTVKGRLFLDSVPLAREVHSLIKRGKATGLSIGFRATESKTRPDGNRTIVALDLAEISIVRDPCHPAARILSVKSVGGAATPPHERTKMDPELKNEPELKSDPVVTPEELKAIKSRLDKIEAKSTRPHAAPVADNDNMERKAFATFLRSGTFEEIKSAGGTFEAKAASSDYDPSGGYFVLPTVDLTIRNLLADLSPMRGLAEVANIAGDRYERFYSLGKGGAQRVAERDDRPQDTARPELIKHSYGVGEYYAAPAATRHQLDDASVDLASWLINEATRQISETEGEDFLSYDGSNGFPRGLLTYDLTNEKDFTRAWGKFQYVPAGHASAPTDANLTTALIKLAAALRKPYKANGTFLMNSNTAVRLRTIVDANGRYLWAPTGNLIEGVEHPLLGYRVEIDDGMPDIGAGTAPIAFGDFKQGYVIVDRHGVRVERDAVTQKGRVLYDTYKRVGGGAGDFNAIKFLMIAAA